MKMINFYYGLLKSRGNLAFENLPLQLYTVQLNGKLTVPQSSILKTRFLILDSRKLWGSRRSSPFEDLSRPFDHQLFYSSLLLCFQPHGFLEISVWNPWKIIRLSPNLELQTRTSKLDSWFPFSKTLRIENRVSSRNCQLISEQYCTCTWFL